MSDFSSIPEINSAIRCLRDAREAILSKYPLTEGNEWVTAPPEEIVEALGRLNAAREHLENLCQFGTASHQLVSRD